MHRAQCSLVCKHGLFTMFPKIEHYVMVQPIITRNGDDFVFVGKFAA